ncbi:MAG TPA: glycosyltransferase [Verrucomicrobiota bacterium]|nr:glycosyltransferase [Verrucomicrobiota bacterium]
MFSVVIPTCDRNDLLALCLDRLSPRKQTLNESDYEVIVTDDGSNGMSRELVRNHFPWARWIRGPRKGPAANRNNGAKHAHADWLVFTDDDCLPGKDFLAGYFHAVNKGEADVLEGRTSPSSVRPRVDMECPANETGGYLWSCNMAIRKSVFDELGGFDENFPGPAMEDVDFRLRLLKAGKIIRFVPEALVLHPWRFRKGKEHVKLVNASIVYFLRKHPEQRVNFTFSSLGMALMRRLLSHLPKSALQCNGRGWINESFHVTHSTWMLYFAVRRSSR